jgi:hypothetical protein
MTEQELQEIARARIDQRNRRWTLWGVDLAAFIAYVGLFIVITINEFSVLALFILLAWSGLFTLHTLVVAMSQTRSKDIENEVTRLSDDFYEKPKRLGLGEDGELVEIEEDDYEAEKAKR